MFIDKEIKVFINILIALDSLGIVKMDQESGEEFTEANGQLESETKVKSVPIVIHYVRLWWGLIWHQGYDKYSVFTDYCCKNGMI